MVQVAERIATAQAEREPQERKQRILKRGDMVMNTRGQVETFYRYIDRYTAYTEESFKRRTWYVVETLTLVETAEQAQAHQDWLEELQAQAELRRGM